MAPSQNERRESGEDWELGSGASAAKKSEVGDGRGKSSKWGPCRGEKFEVGDGL